MTNGQFDIFNKKTLIFLFHTKVTNVRPILLIGIPDSLRVSAMKRHVIPALVVSELFGISMGSKKFIVSNFM